MSPRLMWPQLTRLDLVINELVDKQPLAVVELRQHRRALDDDRLDKKDAEKYKDNDDQKDVAKQLQPLGPESR